MEERSPNIALMDYDVKWIGNDSSSYSLEACITNLGQRNATIVSGYGYALFFDDQNKPIGNIVFPGNENEGILESKAIQGMRLCYFSHALLDFRKFRPKIYFAVICLKIKYKDELLNRLKEKKFYLGWTAKQNDFGGLKDWQFGLAKIWEDKNYQFK